jgi:cyclophilin family peptidyl-prolyl cis-trans isomerase
MSKADKRARKNENKAKARAAAAVAAKRRGRTAAIKRFVIMAFVIAVIGGGLAFLLNKDDDKTAETTTVPPTTSAPIDTFATIETDHGTITIQLDTDAAPIATGKFIELANEGFYDGLTFYRVVDDFMIQGGDPTGEKPAGDAVVGELPGDNYPVGALAAAKTPAAAPGTFSSAFFVVTGSRGATLPNEYARFGMVTEGIEVAQQIAALQAPGAETPSETVTITSITIAEVPATATTATTATTTPVSATTAAATTTIAATSTTVATSET